MARKHEAIEIGSDSVFRDLGFADADERKLRVQLAMRLNGLLEEKRLTQAKAAALLGMSQPHVSELANYKLSRFSSERLLHFLTLLDQDVEIRIRPKPKSRDVGLVSVSGHDAIRGP